MIVVDENFPEEEAEQLRRQGVHVRQIGKDLCKKGVQDENILVALLQKSQPTLLTLDRDHDRPELAHSQHALVWLDVDESRVAEFCVRILRHPEFDTKAKRMGRVIRVSPSGVWYWQVKVSKEVHLEW